MNIHTEEEAFASNPMTERERSVWALKEAVAYHMYLAGLEETRAAVADEILRILERRSFKRSIEHV